jgi:hypothetical protein
VLLDLMGIWGWLMYYDREHGHIPRASWSTEDGCHKHSWRVLLWREFGENKTGARYRLDLPWDAPENKRLQDEGAYCFRTPLDTTKPFCTSYLAITGPGTGFDPKEEHRLHDLPDDLILVVRATTRNIHWMEPRDLVAESTSDDAFAPRDERVVLFADGAVWFLRRDVPFEDLKKFFTVDGASAFDREEVLKSFLIQGRTASGD